MSATLNNAQLAWCREHIPSFAELEAASKAAIKSALESERENRPRRKPDAKDNH